MMLIGLVGLGFFAYRGTKKSAALAATLSIHPMELRSDRREAVFLYELMLQRMSLLVAQSGRADPAHPCPLSGVKQTSANEAGATANDPKRKSRERAPVQKRLCASKILAGRAWRPATLCTRYVRPTPRGALRSTSPSRNRRSRTRRPRCWRGGLIHWRSCRPRLLSR
jgi:hypothetical protein